MQGHIKKRSENSWTLVVSLGRDPQTGKYKQRWQTVEGTKKDAERELRALIIRLENGIDVKPGKLTVGEYLNQWLANHVMVNCSPATANGYRSIIQHHLVPALGKVQLTQLQPMHLQNYYTEALKTGLSNKTVLNIHRLLSRALVDAVKLQLLIRNPATAVTPPRPKRTEMRALTDEQIQAFLSVIANSLYRELYITALYTGMRRAELLGLRWQDVDLDLAQLSVVQTLHKVPDRGFVTSPPKTSKGRRTIALPPMVCILLRRLKERQMAERQMMATQLQEPGLVFTKADGEPFEPSTVSHTFGKIMKKIGAQDVRFHDLRHTHASLLLRQGTNVKVVSERLGHADIGVTLNVYAHVLPGMQEEAALRFEENLKGASSEIISKLLANPTKASSKTVNFESKRP